MSLTNRNFIQSWDRFKLYFPFRKNFILFLGFGLLLIFERQSLVDSMDDKSVFLRRNVVEFLMDFFFQVWLVLLILGLVSCFYAYYYNRTRVRVPENFNIQESYDQTSLTTILSVQLESVMRPFLGSLGLIFGLEDVYSPLQYFGRVGPQRYSLQYVLDMPFIKRYHFKNAYLVHQDVFGFFRIVLPKSIYRNYTQRAILQDIEVDFPPHSMAHDEELASEHIQRVKGEWLHYKVFEPSDDVRRIIWRVYAQNRELVIREQENFSPYTSTVSFYISFLNEASVMTSNPFISDYFLSKYKNACWSIFYKFKKSEGLDVKYMPDQRMSGLEAESPLEHDHEIMSISEWIRLPQLQQYISERESFILCITPLVDLAELEEFLDQHPKILVYIILPVLSEISKTRKGLNLRRLVFRRPTGTEERNLRFYRFLGQHKQYQMRIEQSLKVLENSGVDFIKIEL